MSTPGDDRYYSPEIPFTPEQVARIPPWILRELGRRTAITATLSEDATRIAMRYEERRIYEAKLAPRVMPPDDPSAP